MKSTDAIIYAQQNASEADPIADFAESMFIIDYGVIKTVNDDDTVDVEHAKMLYLKTGELLPAMLTKGVEVLWPSMSLFSFKADLVAGDRVLLLGFKNYLSTVDIDKAVEQTDFYAYSRETMKAVPLCVFDSESQVKVVLTDGKVELDLTSMKFKAENAHVEADLLSAKLKLKNTAQTLKDIMDTLISNLSTMSNTPAVNGSPLWPAGAVQWQALQTKINALLE